MLHNIAGDTLVTVTVLVFVTVLLLLEGLYLIWRNYKGPQARRVEQRLKALAATQERSAQAKLVRERALSEVPLVERVLLSLPRTRTLERMILQAGLDWTVSRLLLWCALLGALALGATWALIRQPLLIAMPAGIAFAALPLLLLLHLRDRRLHKLEQQLPDALDLVTRALRAGHAFSTGLQMIAEEMSEPIASEFRMVSDEVNFGVSQQQALINLSERLPIADLRYFVVSVLIQRDSGGNLTEVLGNLSRLIRERQKLMGRVKVLSAEGRLSAWLLGVMPFALALLMKIFNPDFISPLWTDPIGIAVLKYLLVLMVVGALIMRKIVRIRV